MPLLSITASTGARTNPPPNKKCHGCTRTSCCANTPFLSWSMARLQDIQTWQSLAASDGEGAVRSKIPCLGAPRLTKWLAQVTRPSCFCQYPGHHANATATPVCGGLDNTATPRSCRATLPWRMILWWYNPFARHGQLSRQPAQPLSHKTDYDPTQARRQAARSSSGTHNIERTVPPIVSLSPPPSLSLAQVSQGKTVKERRLIR
ncbi:unnamed protein product [Ectocarpus sp. 12 AP-2014]